MQASLNGKMNIAVSVGESRLDSLRTYIDNQETHHRKKTFEEEYRDFGSKQFS
jgi:hypothetical protein